MAPASRSRSSAPSSGRGRLRAILAGYEHTIATGELGEVLYVYEHPGVARLVRREAAAVGLAEPHIRLRELTQVIADAQTLGTRRPTPDVAEDRRGEVIGVTGGKPRS